MDILKTILIEKHENGYQFTIIPHEITKITEKKVRVYAWSYEHSKQEIPKTDIGATIQRKYGDEFFISLINPTDEQIAVAMRRLSTTFVDYFANKIEKYKQYIEELKNRHANAKKLNDICQQGGAK